MKTEPTEAFRAMANDLKYNVGVIHSNPQLILEESFISGVRYGQSSPKIKQLEWVYDKSDEIYIAKLSMFEYRIWQDNNQSFMKVMINNNHCTIIRCITIEEAKAAAQRDFEKRIKECLE
ncbi:hypothetical protein DSECCO2_197570 [anaerobic digester metagenome]